MAGPVFTGGPTVGSDTASAVLLARVIDVNMSRYTVTVRTEGGKRLYPDLPIGSPYAHHQRGEGFYVVPDVGAMCWIAVEGSGGTPVVLAFGTPPKLINASNTDNPDATPQEGDEAAASYGYRRPKRRPGEFGFAARDGSFLHFRRGGTVELGAGGACQRIFLPLTNLITDISENYQQWTAAGRLVFDTDRTEGSPGDDAKAKWRLMVKKLGVDEEASVLVEAGHLGDNRFRIAIGDNEVNLKTGEFTGTSYQFIVDATKKRWEKAEALDEDVVGAVTKHCGSLDVRVDGTYKLTATLFDILANVKITGTLDVTGAITGASLATTAASMTLNGISVDIVNFLTTKYNLHKHAAVGSVPDLLWP
jgi:hypothetical protein